MSIAVFVLSSIHFSISNEVVSVLVSVQASTNPKVSSEGCIRPNNRGEGQGIGWKGYCCKTSDDCHDTCIKDKCNVETNPKICSTY
ncbi:hypothetical protein G6F43_008348 [Rhizopus delemar]|nr:hypothetical protein G6F43_008348 [Rhizopus delemar]